MLLRLLCRCRACRRTPRRAVFYGGMAFMVFALLPFV
jgi:hypothetical protein